MGKGKVGKAFSQWAKSYGTSDDHIRGVDLAFIVKIDRRGGVYYFKKKGDSQESEGTR